MSASLVDAVASSEDDDEDEESSSEETKLLGSQKELRKCAGHFASLMLRQQIVVTVSPSSHRVMVIQLVHVCVCVCVTLSLITLNQRVFTQLFLAQLLRDK